MNLFKTFTAILTLSLSANFLFAQNLESIARAHIITNNSDFSTNVTTAADLMLVNSHSNNGITHFYFNQLNDGIKIYNAIANIAIDANGNVFHAGNRFVRHAKISAPNPNMSISQSVLSVAASLNQTVVGPINILSQQSNPRQVTLLSNSSISSSEILGELMYLNQGGTLVLAWSVAYQSESDGIWRDVRVNAADGTILDQTLWTVECNFDHEHGDDCDEDHSNHSHTFKNLKTNKESTIKSKASSALVNGDYFVSPIPEESPIHGPLATVNSPWNMNIDPAANPFTGAIGQSWHNDGTTTHFTTRGNNVWAVEDQDADNNQANGFSPTSMLAPTGQQYNFMPNFALAPQGYLDALITNLFYWNNLCHDILYHHGFNEECGNFQVTNATGLGLGSDAVQADAIDGSGTNNANFATPPDGTPGRMQMFEFTQPGPPALNTFLTGNINQTIGGVAEVFANVPWTAANDGSLVLVIDNAGTSEACGVPVPGNISNAAAINGNVALIDRGSCNFTEKIENAEAAGAISAVVCNNVGTPPFAMGGTPANPITIPSIMISMADCNVIKAALPGVSVSFDSTIPAPPAPPNVTSDYDNGIIVHEYAHGWSIRLTGGAANSGCLTGNEQMGEGWSDYLGLLFTMKPGDTGPMPRGIGNYAIGQPTTGGGIRTFPYSTDFAVNPETYGILPTLNNFTATGQFIPHPVGSVWVNMLWDMTWDLIGVYGFGTNIYETNPANPGYGGQNVALSLVTEGLKLQPCNPGFVDGRDAILAADQALFGGVNTCLIWNAFATRGLGFSADQGSSASVLDGTEAFDMPPDALIEKVVSSPVVTDGSPVTWDLTVDILGCMGGGGGFTVTDAVDPALVITSAVCPSPAVVNTAGNNITITHPGFGGNPGTITCNIITTVNTMITATPNQLFFDDVESGNAGWTVNDITGLGVDQWDIVNTASNSPSNAWFIENTDGPDKTSALESPTLALGTNPSVRFFHQYDTEFTWDGGFLEISIDGGATWNEITNDEFCVGGYNTTLNTNMNTDIGGRDAWSGNSGGFIESVALLDQYQNTSAIIRFVFGQDNNTNNVGWWVDDFEVTLDGVTVIENTACVTPDGGGDMVCSTTSTCVRIECTPQILGLTTTSQDASCATGFDGSATVTASGGTAPYTYQWSNGQVAATAVNLIAGNYTVIVTDANGCANTASVTVGAGPDACIGLDIPTMGEWGLICLGLCLLIFGIAVIREREFAIEA